MKNIAAPGLLVLSIISFGSVFFKSSLKPKEIESNGIPDGQIKNVSTIHVICMIDYIT